MLTLGVPGSGTTAVMLGALLLYNIQPGPQLFTERPEIAGGPIASMSIGNPLLLLMNLPMVQIFVRMLLLPNWICLPGILKLAFRGVYSNYASTVSIMMMLGIWVIGYLARKLGFHLAPIILGFLLGKVMETHLRNALAISGGELGILFESTISLTLSLREHDLAHALGVGGARGGGAGAAATGGRRSLSAPALPVAEVRSLC